MLSDLSPLHPHDLGRCQELSKEAGWNQNLADWRFVLEEGVSFGLRRDAHLVATAGVIPYGPFGWICMVLVTAAERRQRFALRLMEKCMDWLEQRGVVAGLDATPAGRTVYRQLGFEDVYGITRLECVIERDEFEARPGIDLAPFGEGMLDRVIAYDRPRFGGERGALLSRWQARAPQSAHVASIDGQICGYVLGRDGLNASHIGPLVADGGDVAVALLEAALSRNRGRILIDVPDHHQALREWLGRRGFTGQRTFTRMLRGRAMPLDRPEQIFALTGAEFG